MFCKGAIVSRRAFPFFRLLDKGLCSSPPHGSFLSQKGSRFRYPSDSTPHEVFRAPEYRNNKKFWCEAGGGYVGLKMVSGYENGVWVQFEYRDFKD
jgi:hypothetical protein